MSKTKYKIRKNIERIRQHFTLLVVLKSQSQSSLLLFIQFPDPPQTLAPTRPRRSAASKKKQLETTASLKAYMPALLMSAC